MSDITITIPDVDDQRVISALCASGGFTDASLENARLTIMNYISTIVGTADVGAANQLALKSVVIPDPVVLT